MENRKGERKRLHYFWPKNKNILFRSFVFRPREASGRDFSPERFVFGSLLAPMRQRAQVLCLIRFWLRKADLGFFFFVILIRIC